MEGPSASIFRGNDVLEPSFFREALCDGILMREEFLDKNKDRRSHLGWANEIGRLCIRAPGPRMPGGLVANLAID
jgi:hypothetical protein